ncbi:MFS transporter [Burkholderia sp. Bp9004]|uniref:MFS transporter n=1 Tax=Burkholderia sp. Bp9004 TaxID=2184559 RepID=UPI000F5E46FC|nr:MFS transporter [Burkholderia sp. Bp9004]RQZ62321.1 MFS transporter [Burkholderia sp. Bp9004]
MTPDLKAQDPSRARNQPSSSRADTSARRAALAGSLGAVIDWYDFFLYGTAAATVFSPLFFPSSEPATGLLIAFSTFAVGFLFRPIGGAVFGHFGDKIGRRTMLLLTVLIMGLASTLIGVLPTYQMVGIWAPIMLVALRAIQGFAVGGEWGGAALMAVESAPRGRRNFLSAGVQTGSFVGLLIGTAVFFLCQKLTTHDQFMAWGWRIPFLLSIFLTSVALWIRRSVQESTAFDEVKKHHAETGAPLGIVLRTNPLQILAVIGMRLLDQSTYYLAFTFALAYVTNYTHVPPSNVMIASMISMALAMVTLPTFAKLADRFGIRWFYAIGSVVGAAAAVPFFHALHTGSIPLITLGFFALINVCHNMATAVQPVWFAGMFDTKVRYSGAGFGYALAGAAGGFMPLVATALVNRAHGSYHPIALLLGGLCLIGGLTSLLSYRWVNLRD